jgi:hypothetical protein
MSPSSAKRFDYEEFSIFSPRPEDPCSPESHLTTEQYRGYNFNDYLSLDSLCSPRDNIDGRMDIRRPTTSSSEVTLSPGKRSLGLTSHITTQINNKQNTKKSHSLPKM